MNRRVYLDHNASTPVHPEVVEAMLPYFGERFGNPSSVPAFGREARGGGDLARGRRGGWGPPTRGGARSGRTRPSCPSSPPTPRSGPSSRWPPSDGWRASAG